MTPDGWQIREFNNGALFEIVFWEDGEKSIEFTLTRDQAEELVVNLGFSIDEK